jgi:hypothetical protein
MLRFCFIVKISVTNKVYQTLANKTSLAYLVSPPLNPLKAYKLRNTAFLFCQQDFGDQQGLPNPC